MLSMYEVYIICGIDRLGKDTLIRNIQNKFGHHFVLHYSKPEKLDAYNGNLYEYQYTSFDNGFTLLDNNSSGFYRTPMIFNRFHLGESVYAPLYRNYSGDYVFDLEKEYCAEEFHNVKLILLTTSDFSFIQDDGESFDFSKKEQEQEMFKAALAKSIFPNKTIIDVANGQGGWKSQEQILAEAIL